MPDSLKECLLALGEAFLFSLVAGIGAAVAEELVDHARKKRKPKKRKKARKSR